MSGVMSDVKKRRMDGLYYKLKNKNNSMKYKLKPLLEDEEVSEGQSLEKGAESLSQGDIEGMFSRGK